MGFAGTRNAELAPAQRSRRKLGQFLATIPWPASFHFHLQCRAEEGGDKDNEGEDERMLDCRRCDRGADDVSDDQDLQTKQDCTPEALAAGAVRAGEVGGGDQAFRDAGLSC